MHIQKPGETEKKKYKKTFDGPRQRPSDADTIQRMLANLPLKRASRKIMCLKDGFRPQRTNQISTNNTKGKLKCGKLIMQTSTFPKSNVNNSKNSKNFKNNPNRRCLRSFNKVLSSRILDTNSTLRVKRKLKNFNNRRTTRQTNSKDTKNVEEHNTIPVKSDSLSNIPSNKITTKKSSIKPNMDNGLAKESLESSNSGSLKCETLKSGSKLTRVKNLLKEKINLKNYFPVKKKQSIDNKKEIDKIEKSKDVKFCEGTNSQQSDVTSGMEVDNTNRNKLSQKFKRKFNIRKKKLLSSNQETSAEDKKIENNETEKNNHVVSEVCQKIVLSKTKMNNKRKLRSSFKKVVNKVKKLKIDITHPFSPLDSSQKLNIENSSQVSSNPFLGEGIHEKEELPLAISKHSELLVEEKKENVDKQKIAFVNTVIKIDFINEDLPVPETILNLEPTSGRDLETPDPINYGIENINILTTCDDSVNQTLLTIETNSTLSDQSPLGSPSMLSPRLKGKIRKPNRGLNDCIAMLTKKAFEETSKADTCLLPVNSVKTIIQENDCILRIPSIEQLGNTENCVLDLSKPKQETERIIGTEYKPNEENLPKLHLCNSIDEIIEDVVENRLSHPPSNVLAVEKPILKIPKFTDKKWIDDVIQSVIDNNTDTSVEMMTKKVKKEKIPLSVVPNSVDKIIEQVINGNFPPIFVPQDSSEQFPEISEIFKIDENSAGKTKTYKFENVSIKINEVDSVLNERSSPVSDGTLEVDENITLNTAFIDYFPGNQSVVEGRKIGRRMRQKGEKKSILKVGDHLEQRRISENESILQHKIPFLETDVDNLFNITEVANKVEEINLTTKSKIINCTSDIIKHSFIEVNEPEHLENKLITLENNRNSIDSDSEDDLPLTVLKRKHTTNVNKSLMEDIQNTSEGIAPNIGSACGLTIQVGTCGKKISVSSILDKMSTAVDKAEESIPPYHSDQITNDFTAEKRIPAINDIQRPEETDSHRTTNLNPKSSPGHENEVSRVPKSKEQLSSIRKSPRTRKVNPAARKTPIKGLNLESKLSSTEIWNSTVSETIFSNKLPSTDKDIEANSAVETKYSGNDSLNTIVGSAVDIEIQKKEEFYQSSAVTDSVFEELGIDLSNMLGVNNNQIRMKFGNENLISQTIPKSTVKKKMKKKRRGIVKPKTEVKKNEKIVLEVDETNAIEEEMKIQEYVKNGSNDTIAIKELGRSYIMDPKIPLDTSITNFDMNHRISLGMDERSATFNTHPIDRSTENNIISNTENISENLVNNNRDEKNNSIVTDIMKTNARDHYKADKKILEDINVNLSKKNSTLKSVDSDNILENVNIEIYDDPSLLESSIDIAPETNISDGLCGVGLDDMFLIHQDSNSQKRKLEQEHPSDSPKQIMPEDTTKMKVGTLRIKHQKNGISKTVSNCYVNKKRSSRGNVSGKLNKKHDETSSVSLLEDKINRDFENDILNTGFVTDLPIINKSGSRKKRTNKNKGIKSNRRYSSKRRSKLSFDGSSKFDVKVTTGDRMKTESCVVDNIEEINNFDKIAEDKEAVLDNDSLLSFTQNYESDAVNISTKLEVIENDIVNGNSSLQNANYSELLQDILPKHNSPNQAETNAEDTTKSKSRKIKKNVNKISKKLRNKDCTVKNNKLLNNANVEASTTGTMSPLAIDLYRIDYGNEYKSQENSGNKKLKNKHKIKRIRKKLNISVRHEESSFVKVFSPTIAEEHIESRLVDTLTDTFTLKHSDLRGSRLDIDAPVQTVLSKPTDLELADKLTENRITKSKALGFELGINENKEHLSPGTKNGSENVIVSNFSTIGRKTRKRGKMENNKLVNCNESPIVPKIHYSETSIDLSTAESNNSSGETVNSSISSRIEQSCYSVPRRSESVETMLNSLSHAIETVDVDLGGRRRMSRSAKTKALENVLEEVLFQWKIDTMNDGGRKKVKRNAKSKALENILENALFQAKIDEHLEGIENTDDSEQLSVSRVRRNTNKRTQLKYSKLGELTEPSIIYTSQSCVNSFDLPVAENSYSFNDKQNVDGSHNIIHETSSLQDLSEPEVNDASAQDSIEIITNNKRNRRARKIESYNENDLAEAIFVKNPDKKIAGAMTKKPIIAKSKLNLINTTKQESPTIICNKHLSNGSNLAFRHSALGLKFEGDSKLEKKPDSDELFDLLKPTTPENSDIVKPRNTFLGSFEISNDFNDDNFDNVFENILENSVAPIHEDLSNSSKQLDSQRIDLYEFTESNSFEKDIVELRKNTSKSKEADDIEESLISNNIDVRQQKNKCQKKDYQKSNKRKLGRKPACLAKQNNYEVSDSSSNSDLKLDTSTASSKHTPNIDSILTNDHAAIKDEKNKHMRITLENKIESCHEGIQSICLICNKSFKRVEVLLKHKTTLTHISRLSEIEAKEAKSSEAPNFSDEDEDSANGKHKVDKSKSEITLHDMLQRSERLPEGNHTTVAPSYSPTTNQSPKQSLKLADIITDVLNKPSMDKDKSSHNFSDIIMQNSKDLIEYPEYRRYKSLGERKSFDSDQSISITDSISPKRAIDSNYYDPQIANNAGTILEKQISLLQNMIENTSGLKYIEEISLSSTHSGPRNQGSPLSIISSKHEDSSNILFPNNCLAAKKTQENFLKPSQLEEISEDSANARNCEDPKTRKVLNRDEELFLECCSLLKSGSEVSNYSKKSNKIHSVLNNLDLKISDEPDWLEPKSFPEKHLIEDLSDVSRIPTPLGDSFADDDSNSNTISSNWDMHKDLISENKTNNKTCEVPTGKNFTFKEAIASQQQTDIDISHKHTKINSILTKVITNPFKRDSKIPTERETSIEIISKPKVDTVSRMVDKKMPTKGALKIFEGLKVSIPTEELNLEEVFNCSPLRRIESNNAALKKANIQLRSVAAVEKTTRKSKPIKNKSRATSKFGFNIKKQVVQKSIRKIKRTLSQCNSQLHDVYDFEETQDNTDVFAKPDYRSFRNKTTDDIKSESDLESRDNALGVEGNSLSSTSSHSNISTKITNNQEAITKKKCMIMGRIFKNALKPKLDEEIKEIPMLDHNELVENYVLSCPKVDKGFRRPKMSEQEMNMLFDKLLDDAVPSGDKSADTNQKSKEFKTALHKRKTKTKNKKRQRSNSDSTDDEFGLNKMSKKRIYKKNTKVVDNCINLEQELKECIGVASRKSQRKCTSGKQNVLVEYWSSDDSAFEAFLEGHLQEITNNSEIQSKKPVSEPIHVTETNQHQVLLPIVEQVSTENIQTDNTSMHPIISKDTTFVIKENKKNKNKKETSPAAISRRKRVAADPLYHWSSSSEDELQGLMEVKAVRDDPEDDDEDRPVQHGWIVGDSPKKLVTMLAQAKGKKTDVDCVKEQGKKKNGNMNS